MLSLLEDERRVNPISVAEVFGQLVSDVVAKMTDRLNQHLQAAVEQLLARPSHRRRARVAPWIKSGTCCHCGSRLSQRFCRNGTRPRQLLTPWGVLHLHLPRVICVCGGSVRLDFGDWLRPYQRLSTEIDDQIRRWGALCLSLRQMQAELRHTFIGQLGLRTLLTRLHQLVDLAAAPSPVPVPPILQVDAIWVTQLRPNGRFMTDAKGRRRPVKGRFKRPLLLALGLWPEANHVALVAWQLGQDESTETWVSFLERLEAQGLRGDKGLRLIIHDGGSGLCAALQEVHFNAGQQRCLFHKLRNILKAIKLSDTLTAHQRRRQRRAILKEFRAIWEAHRYATTLRRYHQVVRKYRTSQPKAVATLRNDFRSTLTYFRIQQHQPTWPRRLLRTTSRLERFNETLRKHFDVARAYHSDAGILAVVAQEAARLMTGSVRV